MNINISKMQAAIEHYALVAEKNIASGIVLIVDDNQGIYMGKSFQEEALECGWYASEAVLDTDEEWYHEASDEAMQWMNENVAADGWCFSWEEGGIWYLSMKGYSDDCDGWSEEVYTAYYTKLMADIDELLDELSK